MTISSQLFPVSPLPRSPTSFTRYHYMVPPGLSLADVMTSALYVHIRQMFRANDIIEAQAADSSFDAEIRILSISTVTGQMTFRLLRAAPGLGVSQPLPVPVATTNSTRYDVKHAGHGKWRVIDVMDGRVLADGLDKRAADAEAAILNNPAPTPHIAAAA